MFYAESATNYQLQTTTVWSFPDRGEWATHRGDYRGNWSPHIPRNVILRYSKPKEVVLDCFVGSGTTLIETKLLERYGIGVDIDPRAIDISRERLNFKSNGPEPSLFLGDARNLSFLPDGSVDLVCTHPPYANILRYSEEAGDLSALPPKRFVEAMSTVAGELFRVLRTGGHCAILIGDMRKQRHVVPLGFWTLQKFLDAGFVLREIAIKEQHNCKATRMWTLKSIEMNFLLLAHEYLFVFRHP